MKAHRMTGTAVFRVSLRIGHPSMRPEDITAGLGLEPHMTHSIGEPRKTPAGTTLERCYERSYWVCRLGEGGRFSDIVRTCNDLLISKSAFLDELVPSGGNIEYFVGCFIDGNIGDELDRQTMETCARLKITVGLDMYGSSS